MSIHVTVLQPANASRNATCHLCLTFEGQTDPEEFRLIEARLSSRVSQRSLESANAASITIESSLITIPVVAAETGAPRLTGGVAVLTPYSEEERSLRLRLDPWGLRIVRRMHRSY